MLDRYFFKPATVDRIRGCWLGEAIERYVTWLSEHGYQARSVHHRVPLLVRFAAFTAPAGTVATLGDHLEAFVQAQLDRRRRQSRSARARQVYIRDTRSRIHHFLRIIRMGEGAPATARRPFAHWAPGFFAHLQDERGLSPLTIEGYAVQLRSLERYLTGQAIDDATALAPVVLDRFLAEQRTHVSPRSLGMTCAALRAFLRYLYRAGLVPRDLSVVIEGPRTYRLSDVPRAITADDVGQVLGRIDRRARVGKRDYGMLVLMVVYGLRAREIAALTLDDLDWHASVIHVRARKAGHAAAYPLTGNVGEALLDYLQHGRSGRPDRHVFLRMVAPHGAVTAGIVADRATHALQQAGVTVPRPGSHTLRHSCAQRLVDADFSLKVIGDYLGHRRASSTRIYSKVAIEALRDVARGEEAVLP